MTARAEAADRRLAVYGALRRRNRIIGILRIGLPVLGALVFLGFALQIFLAGLGGNFGIGKISFSGDAVTVDTPSYSGVMADGDVYKVSAEAAQAAIANLNVIDLSNAALQLTKPDGTQMSVKAAAGSFETINQVVTVPGTAEVSDSRGNSGSLAGVVADLPHQTVSASGRVRISLSGGTTIESDGLDYDARANRWDFGRATVTLPADNQDSGESP